jgi:hypothetical protein
MTWQATGFVPQPILVAQELNTDQQPPMNADPRRCTPIRMQFAVVIDAIRHSDFDFIRVHLRSSAVPKKTRRSRSAHAAARGGIHSLKRRE